MNSSTGPPLDIERADIEPGDVLCDRRLKECFKVASIDEHGVGLQYEDTEFYVPYSLFAPWYGSRLYHIEDSTTIDPPDWVLDELSDESDHADESNGNPRRERAH
jgi:hypothetical protein